jgi:hypothetical protein
MVSAFYHITLSFLLGNKHIVIPQSYFQEQYLIPMSYQTFNIR